MPQALLLFSPPDDDNDDHDHDNDDDDDDNDEDDDDHDDDHNDDDDDGYDGPNLNSFDFNGFPPLDHINLQHSPAIISSSSSS